MKLADEILGLEEDFQSIKRRGYDDLEADGELVREMRRRYPLAAVILARRVKKLEKQLQYVHDQLPLILGSHSAALDKTRRDLRVDLSCLQDAIRNCIAEER